MSGKSKTNYNIKTHLSTELKDFIKRYKATKKKFDTAKVEFKEHHKYIYFLHNTEKYEKSTIASLLGIHESRVRAIIRYIDSSLVKGGVLHE